MGCTEAQIATFRTGENTSAACAKVIRARVGLDTAEAEVRRVYLISMFSRSTAGLTMNSALQILDRQENQLRPDAQMVFDICQEPKRPGRS